MALESKQTHEKLLRTFLKRQAIKAALGDRRSKESTNMQIYKRILGDDGKHNNVLLDFTVRRQFPVFPLCEEMRWMKCTLYPHCLL